MPCPIWEWGAWGPPACPLWDLGSPSNWGYMGSPLPILLWNWGPHDLMWGAPVGGIPLTPPCSFRELGSPMTPG